MFLTKYDLKINASKDTLKRLCHKVIIRERYFRKNKIKNLKKMEIYDTIKG